MKSKDCDVKQPNCIYMKAIKYMLTTFIILGVSCEDFLDESDPSRITIDDFYQTAGQAIEAVNAIYEVTQDQQFYGQSMNMLNFEELRGRDVRIPVKPWNEGGQVPFEQFTFTETNGTIQNVWERMYRGINRANLVIANVPAIQMDENLKNRLVGEARFLRAYFYFTLVRLWGSVPLVTQPSEGLNNTGLTNSPVEDIYNQIEEDLLFGAGKTSEYEGLDLFYEGDDLSRVTRGAALGLLNRVYLYQQKWAQSVDAARDVINLGRYQLEQNFSDVFTFDNKYTNSEVIFHIDYEGQKSVINRVALWTEPTDFFITEVRLNSGRRGRGRFAATWDAFNAFDEPGDSRRDWTFIYPTFTSWERDIDGNPVAIEISLDDINEFPPAGSTPLIQKYRVENQNGGEGNPSRGNASNAWPVIRYSDILLMLAEAINEDNNGPTGEAYDAINQVRARARTDKSDPTQVPDLVGLDYNSFQEAVYKERRLELYFEGHSVSDLIRTGRYNRETASKDGEAYFWEDKFRLLPIPQRELDVNQNDDFVQNELWQ